MTLKEYVDTHRLTTEAVAAAIGVSQPFASRLIGEKREPSAEVAIRIEAWTKGAVTAASLNKGLAQYDTFKATGRLPLLAGAA